MIERFHPIGVPGQPWGEAERSAWRAQQRRQRSYAEDVLDPLARLHAHWDVQAYGELDYAPDFYPLVALHGCDWDHARPVALVTGGVHGYETSGVHGALKFAADCGSAYEGRINLLVVPCVSPWAYEHVQRWNPAAVDPNRSFGEHGAALESIALMRLLAPLQGRVLVHVDLHETTDSDESEFRPALAARDGKPFEPNGIPDGFYLVGDSENPQPQFQQAIIAAVERITHIAPADAQGMMIGSPVVAPGLINYPVKSLGLCAGISGAKYVTTTEVYPDSPKATAAQCNDAQVAAVCAAIDYALAHG
ncbi:M14 family metallopeptidase [Pseudoxanthomonas daejeonensis]|uniref:Peptidase n=1 Tax=Pseudoxanthomonas daejeonensis TaxID=266062 RepID=A0ABQ6Z6B2_9GAMM|nr:M14 family metallocarboxypeptidase [Pseudoxanthomonas daejeonensis]KAF1694087.1 peptidase [Pseudoxanthomonas daejeonensis]